MIPRLVYPYTYSHKDKRNGIVEKVIWTRFRIKKFLKLLISHYSKTSIVINSNFKEKEYFHDKITILSLIKYSILNLIIIKNKTQILFVTCSSFIHFIVLIIKLIIFLLKTLLSHNI